MKIHSFAAEPNKILSWEILESHSTVHILVDNIETKEILLVKQPRIPVLLRDQSQLGLCVETCAGLIDKEGKNPFEIAKKSYFKKQEALSFMVRLFTASDIHTDSTTLFLLTNWLFNNRIAH